MECDSQIEEVETNMNRLITLALLALAVCVSASGQDRYGVMVDSVGMSNQQMRSEFDQLLNALEVLNRPCESAVRFKREGRRWQVSAGRSRAYFWLDSLAGTLVDFPKLRVVGLLLGAMDVALTREYGGADFVMARDIADCDGPRR